MVLVLICIDETIRFVRNGERLGMKYDTVKLGDISWINTESYSSKENWIYVNYLDTGNITENMVSEIQHIEIGKEKLPSRAKRKVKYNSIIYSTVRPNQKHYGIIKELPNNFLVSTGFTVIDIDTEKASSDYVYFVLTQESVTEYLHAIAEQSTSAYPSIKPSDLKNIEIRLPSLEHQKRIASILVTLNKKIDINMRINDNLFQQAQAILTSFFIDFSHFDGTIPEDWEQGTLQDIADFSNGYAFKSKELLNVPESNCYQVFKQGHINRGGGFNSSGTKSWYPVSKCTNLSKYVLRKGDVLMAMTDMKDNVAILGNTALMTLDNQYIVNQRVGLLRSNGYKGTSYAYIYLLTNNFDFLKDLRSRANSGVQVNLSSNEIKNSPVLIASNAVNEEFNALTEPLLKMIMANDIENQKLVELRGTLLPKLMSGELDVSNINF